MTAGSPQAAAPRAGTSPDGDDVLGRIERCWLGVRGDQGPLLAPTATWSDGAGLWLTAVASSPHARALSAQRDCVLWVPPSDADPSDPGALVVGHARVFGLGDPLGLALHAPTISAAMASLAVRQATTLVGYAQDAALSAPRLALRNRVVVRVRILRVRGVVQPDPGPGIAPALPPVVPAEVRRGLSGRRHVVVAGAHDDGLVVAPAVWGAGFALAGGDDVGLPPVGPVTVGVDGPGDRPADAVALALTGVLDHRPALRPDTATWWRGWRSGTAAVASPVGGIALPD